MIEVQQSTSQHTGKETGGETYESLRPYLFAVAYRMTGTASDAEDLVQDAWIRYLDAGSPPVTSLKAYLTTIVSRLTLDHLKSARMTRESYVGAWLPEPVLTQEAIPGPDATVEQREAVSIAFLTLLERLTPDQRVVFVLRSGFGLPFAEIGAHLDRSAAACRQLFQRAERVLDAIPDRPPSPQPGDPKEAIVRKFLTALEAGDLQGVTSLLTEQATWIGDGGERQLSVRRTVRGADKIARGMVGLRTKFPRRKSISILEDLNGGPAVVEWVDGTLFRVSSFTVVNDRIASVQAILNPDKLTHLARTIEPAPERRDDK
ncbi:MAG: RNA polymerase sigma factor SigJ [Thermomicrobiales bacterium]